MQRIGEASMSKSSEPERHEWQPHEFQAYKQTPYCGFSMSNIKAHRCGQPESAEVHAVEPRCVNHCGHHRSFIVNGVCNWKRTRGASEICGHVCEFATASEKVSQLPERPWPWAEFPEDSSTWQECVNQYVELKREIESLRAKADAPTGGERRFGQMVIALLQKHYDEARELAMITHIQQDTEGPFVICASANAGLDRAVEIVNTVHVPYLLGSEEADAFMEAQSRIIAALNSAKEGE